MKKLFEDKEFLDAYDKLVIGIFIKRQDIIKL